MDMEIGALKTLGREVEIPGRIDFFDDELFCAKVLGRVISMTNSLDVGSIPGKRFERYDVIAREQNIDSGHKRGIDRRTPLGAKLGDRIEL